MMQTNKSVTISSSSTVSNTFSCNPNEGVTLYFNDDTCVDIDVEPGVGEVVFSGVSDVMQNILNRQIKLRGINKSFPDVKTLVIKEDIFDIDISNYMFPNVREVQSASAAFRNGPYLISELSETVLLNSFCLKNGEAAECVQAWVIGDYAFEGCEITDGFFSDYSVPIRIREHAFDDSAFLDIPSENGVKAIGSVVFAYDDDAEEINFKHLSHGRYVCSKNMSLKNVKCAIIDDVTDMDMVIPLPEIVVINNAKCELSNISSYLNTDKVKSFDTVDGSSVCVKNGILYSKDMEYLIKCPKKKTGDIKIPEGVKYIVKYAFFNAEISSVSFPSTLQEICQDAFR